jgi:hypothetical protein
MAAAQLALKIAIGGVILYALQILIKTIIHTSKYKLPPRVPGLPIVGNTFQIPPIQQGPWAKQLAKKYGEM